MLLSFATVGLAAAWRPDPAELSLMANATRAGAAQRPEGPCIVTAAKVDCPYRHTQLLGRWVGYQVPQGAPPDGGWPTVVLFHGTDLYNSVYCWYAESWYSYGLFHKAELVARLLRAGYAVVTPDALASLGYWQTNVRRYATADLTAWLGSDDDRLVEALLSGCRTGALLGPCDAARLAAVGFSSGAYMTSRMAFSYSGIFRALALQSGSYYYCDGPCSDAIADELPASLWRAHPPTLLLHGGADGIVPPRTSHDYAQKLRAHAVPAARTVDPPATHQWIAAAPEAVLSWLAAHLATAGDVEAQADTRASEVA